MTKEKSIIFSTEEVRAIVDGRKTMTRMVVKPQPTFVDTEHNYAIFETEGKPHKELNCPYGKVGDILWVKETWQESECFDFAIKDEYVYKANEDQEDFANEFGVHWKSSVCMPRAAARLFLKVKDIRVERLQDITEQDILAEGTPFDREIYEMPCNIQNAGATYLAGCFMRIWDSINAKRGYGWDLNPWVWVIEFERAEGVN